MPKTNKAHSTVCGKCAKSACYPLTPIAQPVPQPEDGPPFCPMRRYSDVMQTVKEEYQKSEVKEFARLASVQEYECYEVLPEGRRAKFPRIEETIQFAQKCGYKKIGFAFCNGLKQEVQMITEIFEGHDFEVVSVNCKVGAIPKEFLDIKADQKIAGPDIMETMCNPIAQAEVLNAENVDLAVMLGLCVGHDALFIKYINHPCTVLAVKDRVLGHNPLAAVYLSKGPYYGRLRGYADKKTRR